LARADANLSACALAVKRYDRDRWFCTLFAPEARRDDLFAIYAFNAELAGVSEKVSEPLLGEIRLQWWREAIEGLYGGSPRHHDVVLALKSAIGRHSLDRRLFERLIDGRASDLAKTPPEDLDALEIYARETSAPLMRLALQVLGVSGGAAEAAADAGATGYALSGLLRATPHLLSAGRVLLPAQVMAQTGLADRDLRAGQGGAALVETVRAVADRARRHVSEARMVAGEVPRQAVPALLPVALAASDLRRLARLGHGVFDPRLGERRGGRLVAATFRALRGRY
jgi:NADH dehydrogenase [ubiquinone] 1 alpha subcomplex assembly factor 6